ncbi:MAG: molybdopterin-dependent oxidoreductase [bacterium]|nr:molybdopterin-dependent oxidoreductase [bacterium]
MAIKWHKSTCPYCGFGCGLMVGVNDNKIVEIRGMKEHPTNKGDTCLKPVSYMPLFDHNERLRQPMLKRDGKLAPVSWDEAVAHVSSELKRIIESYGPDSVAFYGGAINLTEEYYLMNKLMKAAIGTNNLECSTRICMASTAFGFVSTLGADAPPACYDDIEKADLFFIAGCNMAISVPVLFKRLTAAREKNKTRIIVVDPRRTQTAEIADLHLRLRPGTDVALNNTIVNILFEKNYVDEEAVTNYTSGLSNLKEFVKDYTAAKGEEITGCPKEQIIEAAHMIGRSKAMLSFWFQGYNHSTQAMFKNNSLHNISLLTENFCKPGAGPLSITGECNALGNRWVGALSHLIPGMRAISNSLHRQEVADFWDLPMENIQPVPGLSVMEMFEKLHTGDIRALWVATTNPAASLPNTKWVHEALDKAELLVVQDIFFPTETARKADVVLAAAQWCEKTGTIISSERRIELVEALIEPPGEALPDAEIICRVARAMGYEKQFPYTRPREIFEEWKQITKGRICDMRGVTYEGLRGKVGPQLPCPEENHPGTERLFTDGKFPRSDGRAALLSRNYRAPAEAPDENYPLELITGRIRGQFNTRTRTGRCPNVNAICPDPFVELNPADAAQKGIGAGDRVKVESRRGSIVLPAILTDSILPGTVFVPWHFGPELGTGDGKLANEVTNAVYDTHSKQPEYKYSAVSITKMT